MSLHFSRSSSNKLFIKPFAKVIARCTMFSKCVHFYAKILHLQRNCWFFVNLRNYLGNVCDLHGDFRERNFSRKIDIKRQQINSCMKEHQKRSCMREQQKRSCVKTAKAQLHDGQQRRSRMRDSKSPVAWRTAKAQMHERQQKPAALRNSKSAAAWRNSKSAASRGNNKSAAARRNSKSATYEIAKGTRRCN